MTADEARLVSELNKRYSSAGNFIYRANKKLRGIQEDLAAATRARQATSHAAPPSAPPLPEQGTSCVPFGSLALCCQVSTLVEVH